jgi:hypothetical protein
MQPHVALSQSSLELLMHHSSLGGTVGLSYAILICIYNILFYVISGLVCVHNSYFENFSICIS